MFSCLYFNGSTKTLKTPLFSVKVTYYSWQNKEKVDAFHVSSGLPPRFPEPLRDTFPKPEKIFTGALTSILGGISKIPCIGKHERFTYDPGISGGPMTSEFSKTWVINLPITPNKYKRLEERNPKARKLT